MARQSIKPNPSEKLFEAYMDFSGGVNVKTSNEKLRDNEFTVMENVDLSGRGSAKRRHGRVNVTGLSGNAQMIHPYYRQFQNEPDLIIAISGKLYVKEWNKSTLTQIPITDNGANFTFQTTLPIEATQYRSDLFIATGTKLVELTYDSGWKAKTVVPYKPTVMEYIHIGSNAIASDPATWVQQKEASSVEIEGITPSIAQGGVNTPIRFTAHVKKPANIDVNHTFSTRKTGSGTFTTRKSNSPQNYADITFDEIGGYDIKVDTKKVTYPIATWNVDVEGWTNAFKGNEWDSADGYGCLIINNTVANPNDSTLKTWKDFSTPLDLSKGDTLEWWWTVFSQDTQYGMDDNSIQLKFYTQGNLTTPILTVGNKGGTGRGMGGGWKKETSTYNGSVTGMDKIVRIGFAGSRVGSGVYKPGNGSWNIDPDDTTSRFDNITFWKSGTETSYTMTDYQVVGVPDPTKDPDTYSAIHTSRMIRLHWDRIILGKDNKYPGQLYISDLNNPRYFPMNKRIDFSLDRKEPITSVVRFQDMLVIFTKTTISTLTGKHPQDGDIPVEDSYRVALINDTLGCIADRSAKVVGNDIIFLSNEGIQMLRPNPYRLESLNVRRIDHPVEPLVVRDQDACSLVYDNQYWICFPSQKIILRLDYNSGTWVKDTSTKLNFVQFYQYGSNIYNLTKDGNIYKHDPNVYNDCGEVYEMKVESKMLDLSSSFNFKKLRRMYILFGTSHKENVSLTMKAYADSALANPDTTGKAVVNPDGSVTWQTSTELPNLNFYRGTIFGKWLMGLSAFGEINATVSKISVTGKCRRVKVTYSHKEDKFCEIFGFGLEFKLKKV